VRERRRRLVAVLVVLAVVLGGAAATTLQQRGQDSPQPPATTQHAQSVAADALQTLAVKGRAPKTGYSRDQFGSGWKDLGDCDTRNYILKRDLTNVQVRSATDCTVLSGTLHDPYTDKIIQFTRGPGTSTMIQIDHVVALSDAWQKGAQQLTPETREQLANDPLELLAVDGPTNQAKSDGDAATWLPPNKGYRCQYVARQIAVKAKYKLWVTSGEHDAMQRILDTCPGQALPAVTSQ